MAKAQYPIDGKQGKTWKITSIMGWRVHPVEKTKKHHNGTDIWSPVEPCYIESFYDGKVLYAGPSKLKKADGEPGGFGYYVQVQHKIDGVYYTSCYAHMKKGSLAVKKGQKITAGTVLGKMGTTGMSTGKHLHFEIWKGTTHGWSANGKGFVEPIGFIKALIAKEAAAAEANKSTPEDAPVVPTPVHEAPAKKPAVAKAVVAKPVVAKVVKPAVAKVAYPGHYLKVGSKDPEVKYLQEKLKIAVTGVFDIATDKAVKALQAKHKLVVDGVVGPKTWAKLG